MVLLRLRLRPPQRQGCHLALLLPQQQQRLLVHQLGLRPLQRQQQPPRLQQQALAERPQGRLHHPLQPQLLQQVPLLAVQLLLLPRLLLLHLALHRLPHQQQQPQRPLRFLAEARVLL